MPATSTYKLPSHRQSEEEKARPFVAVVVIFKVDAVPLPVTNGIAYQLCRFIQDLIIKEASIPEVIQQSPRLCFVVCPKNAWQRGYFTDPLPGSFHILGIPDLSDIGTEAGIGI